MNDQKLNGFNNGRDTTDGVGGMPSPSELSKQAANIIQPKDHLPDAKTIPSREEAFLWAGCLYSQAGQRRIHAFMDCYDWIQGRMKP